MDKEIEIRKPLVLCRKLAALVRVGVMTFKEKPLDVN